MDNKKISIDLDHFKISNSGGGTRKRKEKADGESNPIRVRQPHKPRDRTTKRHSLLKFLRKHQENNYRKLHDEEGYGGSIEQQFHDNDKNELDDTLGYLMNLADKQKEQTHTAHSGGSSYSSIPNYTLKHYANNTHMGGFTNENISMEFPINVPNSGSSMKINPSAAPTSLHPQYGCLKGGSLPTYRKYMRDTNSSDSNYINSQQTSDMNYNQRRSLDDVIIHPPQEGHLTNFVGGSPSEYRLDNNNKLQRNYPQNYVDPTKVKLKYVRQKRTNSRTFKIGKSKTHPKIGVLISNRTIRKGITTQSHLLKQTPMHEIRKFLEKRGLIKVGTAAPNEILRKMYESSKMLCGEVYNHNSDTLLHNFIHM